MATTAMVRYGVGCKDSGSLPAHYLFMESSHFKITHLFIHSSCLSLSLHITSINPSDPPPPQPPSPPPHPPFTLTPPSPSPPLHPPPPGGMSMVANLRRSSHNPSTSCSTPDLSLVRSRSNTTGSTTGTTTYVQPRSSRGGLT